MQATALSQRGVAWSEETAMEEFLRLVKRNLIKVRPERPAANLAETGKLSPPIKARYCRVLADER